MRQKYEQFRIRMRHRWQKLHCERNGGIKQSGEMDEGQGRRGGECADEEQYAGRIERGACGLAVCVCPFWVIALLIKLWIGRMKR